MNKETKNNSEVYLLSKGFDYQFVSQVLNILRYQSVNSKKTNLNRVLFIASYYTYFNNGDYVDEVFLAKIFNIEINDISKCFNVFRQRMLDYNTPIILPKVSAVIEYYGKIYNIEDDSISSLINMYENGINKVHQENVYYKCKYHAVAFLLSIKEVYQMDFTSDLMTDLENNKNVKLLKPLYLEIIT